MVDLEEYDDILSDHEAHVNTLHSLYDLYAIKQYELDHNYTNPVTDRLILQYETDLSVFEPRIDLTDLKPKKPFKNTFEGQKMKTRKKKKNIISRIIHNIRHDYESKKNWEMKMNTPVRFTIISSPDSSSEK